ncbi:MAG: hypothetical protein GY708_09250, partial [Actinomycetia bacterium]|nr:hypothetical protein [Actinomycetes bacterium]
GAIWIETTTLAGVGEIAADGGSHPYDHASAHSAGGGGRIAVTYDTNTYTGIMSAYGGTTAYTLDSSERAGAGTVFTRNRLTEPHGRLIVANNNVVTQGFSTRLQSEGVLILNELRVVEAGRLQTPDPIVIQGGVGTDTMQLQGNLAGARLFLSSVETLELNGGELATNLIYAQDVNLIGSSLLRHWATTTSVERGLVLSLDTLTVEAGSRVDVSNLGYLGGSRSGNTANGDAHPDGVEAGSGIGGSYGGLGGKASASASYGDFRAPYELGGGGYGQTSSQLGGNGGGRVHIVANSLTVDGQILANGQDVPSGDLYANGGAGGAIWIETTTLAGVGEIAADGGSPLYNTGNAYSAGGGGRVSVTYDTNTYTGIMTAYGGTTAYTQDSTERAGAGTIFLLDTVNHDYGVLIVDNGDMETSGYSTRLPTISGGTITSLTGDTLEDDSALFPLPGSTSLGLAGLVLNPNTSQGVTFDIVGNDATQIQVDPLADLTAVAAVSDTYAIEYHLDDLQVLGRARLYSANSIVVHGTSGSDVMVVGGLLGT